MRLRLILSFALVVLVAILTVLVIFQQGTTQEVRMFMARGMLAGLDEVVADLETSYAQSGSWLNAQAILANARLGQGMGMMRGNVQLRLADLRGNVLADSSGAPSGQISRAEQQASIELNDANGRLAGYLLVDGGPAMMGRRNETQLMDRLERAGWIAAGVAGGLALLLALVLSFGLLRPVQELTSAAAKMASGDLSQRVIVRGRDEVSALGKAFNDMASSLQKAEQNRRLMTADIAHELRTPVAIQRAHLEALQDGVYPLTIENLEPVLEQTALLTRLVEDLRTLALADAGELHVDRVPTDLPALARRVVERFQPKAVRRLVQIEFENQAEEGLSLAIDPGRVEQILTNLLSNAVRYTPENGTVRVTLKRAGHQAVIAVADCGPGISPEVMPRLFERFFRADRSRSREEGGTGLGLAIARQFALAHNGDLTAGNNPGGGAVFTLYLPL